MSNKTVQLKDREGNNLYPKTPLTNVIGLAPGLNNRHIFFGSGTPSNVKSSYEDIQVNDLYIDTSTSTRDGIFYRVSSFYTADVPKISWDMYGYYFMKSGTPPTTDSDWSMAFGGAASPYPRKGLLWCDTNTGHIYEFIGAPNDLRWRCLTDNYSKSELDTMIAAFQPDIDEKADRIEDSRQGSAITLEDSAEIDIPEITLFGKSVQNGTPSIDNPVAIEDVSSEDISITRKNIIPLQELTKSNLYLTRCTCTITDKINITATTTSSSGCQIGVTGTNGVPYSSNAQQKFIKIPIVEGQKIKGTISGDFNKVFVQFLDKNYTPLASRDYNYITTNVIVAPSGSKWISLAVGVTNCEQGAIYSGNIQLEIGEQATDFEFYSNSQVSTLSKPLRGIPVTSGGNYTDNNGQQWICDTIERYEDGTGKLIQRVGSISGSVIGANAAAWYGNNVTANKIIGFNITNSQPADKNLKSYAYCTHFQTANIYQNRVGFLIGGTQQSDKLGLVFGFGLDSTMTFDERKQWVQNLTDDLKVVYLLYEYIETPLTAEELAQLDLSTYYPITNITSNPDIKITYVADTKNYFDKKLEQIQNAIISNGGNV